MKKTIYSVLIASILVISLSATAIAATSSLIGKKVQSVIPVELDGKAIKDAIVIDGTTYAPVRSLSDASGYTLTIEEGAVKMTSSSKSPVTEPVVTIDAEINVKTLARIQILKNEIEWNKELIRITESESIALLKKSIAEQLAYTVDVEVHQSMADSGQKNLDKELAYVAELQAKITAANEEITKLEATLK